MINTQLVALVVMLLILPAYALTSGTIQQCFSSGDTYCNINVSSTITGTDFILNNMNGVNISTGTTITLNYSRLTILGSGRSSYIIVNGTINASGTNGQVTSVGISATGGSGGSGGSAIGFCAGGVGSTPASVGGATNGNSGGAVSDNFACGAIPVSSGVGSSLLPYVNSAGIAGNYTNGGGFYATGGGFVAGSAGGQSVAASGGSGNVVKLLAGTVNISSTGEVLDNAGKSAEYNNGGASAQITGSGGGEVDIYGISTNIDGNITTNGSNGIGVAGGGNGGKILDCYSYSNSVSGILGIGAGAGGTSGNITNTSSSSCFPLVSPYITIISPQQPVYQVGQTITANVLYSQAYTNCSIVLNNITEATHVGIITNEVTSDILSNMTLGTNLLEVDCYNSAYPFDSVPDTKSMQFTLTETNIPSSGFYQAFGINLAQSNCSTATQNALITSCNEYYNFTTPYAFAAVVCPNFVFNSSYSCLAPYGLSNVSKQNNFTKNNYTILYSPSSWNYPMQNGAAASNEQHIGALFYFGNSPLQLGIELYEPNYFIYIPAQNEVRDCNVFYLSNTTVCSYGKGFTLNDKDVFLGDTGNNWYVANGQGIVYFSANYSNTTIPVNVLSTANTGVQLFPNGIYTRLNCYVQQNSSYITDIVNTNNRFYSIVAVYNNTNGSLSYYAYNTTSQTFYQNISLINPITNGTLTYVLISDTQGTICSWDGKSTIFLPFNIPSISLGVFSILLDVFLLFTVIVGCFIPYALFASIIINDVYSVMPTPDMAIIFAFAAIAGLTINAFSFDRGVKHLFIVLGIGAAYLGAIQTHISSLGIDLTPLTSILTNSQLLLTCEGTTNCLWQFVSNAPAYIMSIFVYVLELPFNVIYILGMGSNSLLYIISPTLAVGLEPFIVMIAYAGTLYFYLKAYEVLANKFRSI
jgi:hypothetical protein